MRLLLRFMDPMSGDITIGGKNLRDISRYSWMRSIGYIAQHPEVFDGTVRENLTYRLSEEERRAFSDEALWSLMRSLEIDFGQRLENGLETRVGKHGLRLSGGQAQRLMIGAAVIGKPWFMVIDEATSSLDSTTERKVQRGLEKILSGNTSALIVAHRLSTVRHLCSKFVVLKPSSSVRNGDSQVEAVGYSFEELYQTSPTFRELADDQEVQIKLGIM
jgi:ABC-type multidrug transport system fused ATPase/permease subunit